MGVGDRAHDREAEAGTAGGTVAGGVGAVETVEHPLALLDRDPWTVILDDEAHPFGPPPTALGPLDVRTHRSAVTPLARALDVQAHEARSVTRPPGVGDRVAQQVAQRLCEPVGVGEQRARGHLPELEAPRREQGRAAPQLLDEGLELDRLQAQELCLLGLGEHQEVVHEAGDAGDLCLHEALHAPHLLAGGLLLSGEYLELAADHGQRRAQLVRGVRDERTLARERVGETVEHVVEGVGEHPHLLALALDVVDPRVQVTGVHLRRHRGHPAQRAREARTDRQRGEQRPGEREQAREDERPRHAALGARHARQRLPHAHRHELLAETGMRAKGECPRLRSARARPPGMRTCRLSRRR